MLCKIYKLTRQNIIFAKGNVKFTALKDLISSLESDVAKIVAGNKAARTRVRVGLQKVKTLAQELRIDINGMD